MKDHLIKLLLIAGLRDIANINDEKIKPTPIATPVKHIIGIPEAKYLNPIKTKPDKELLALLIVQLLKD